MCRLDNGIPIFIVLLIWVWPVLAQPTFLEGNYVFSLPEQTGYLSRFAYVDVEKGEYLRTTPVRVERAVYIEVYDLENGTLKRSIRLTKPHNIDSFLKDEEGNYWVFNGEDIMLYQIDSVGTMLRTISANDGRDVPDPYTLYYASMNYSPLVLHDNRIYFPISVMAVPGARYDSKQLDVAGVVRQVDLASEELSFQGRLPESLRQYDFGYHSRFNILKKGENLVVAPFFSNEISIYGLASGNTVFPIIPKNDFFSITRPFAELKDNPDFLKEGDAGNRHYDDNGYYFGILYDSYRNVFYRILLSPKIGIDERAITVVVMSDTFGYISHYELPADYSPIGMFVTSLGLNVFNKAKYDEDYSKLVFDTIQF